MIITGLVDMDSPGDCDDKCAWEKEDKLGELEKLGVDGGEGEGDENW